MPQNTTNTISSKKNSNKKANNQRYELNKILACIYSIYNDHQKEGQSSYITTVDVAKAYFPDFNKYSKDERDKIKKNILFPINILKGMGLIIKDKVYRQLQIKDSLTEQQIIEILIKRQGGEELYSSYNQLVTNEDIKKQYENKKMSNPIPQSIIKPLPPINRAILCFTYECALKKKSLFITIKEVGEFINVSTSLDAEAIKDSSMRNTTILNKKIGDLFFKSFSERGFLRQALLDHTGCILRGGYEIIINTELLVNFIGEAYAPLKVLLNKTKASTVETVGTLPEMQSFPANIQSTAHDKEEEIASENPSIMAAEVLLSATSFEEQPLARQNKRRLETLYNVKETLEKDLIALCDCSDDEKIKRQKIIENTLENIKGKINYLKYDIEKITTLQAAIRGFFARKATDSIRRGEITRNSQASHHSTLHM